MDCLAQTVDRALSGQTVDRLRKAWIKLAQSVDMGQTVDYGSRGRTSIFHFYFLFFIFHFPISTFEKRGKIG